MKRKEGLEKQAAHFRLVGGPHHDQKVRMYAPWDELKFGDGNVYEIHGPLDRTDEWVYVWTRKEEDEVS